MLKSFHSLSESLPIVNQALIKQHGLHRMFWENGRRWRFEEDGEIFVGEDLLDNPQSAPMKYGYNSILSQAIKQSI